MKKHGKREPTGRLLALITNWVENGEDGGI